MIYDQNNSAALTPHITPEDLMLYVLEMLTPEERRAMEEHLDGSAECALCQQELAAIRNDLGLYAVASVASVGMETAPSRSRDRLLAELTTESSAFNATPPQEPVAMPARPAMEVVGGGKASSNRKVSAVAWIGWAIAAGLALVATHFYQDRESLRSSLSTQAGQIAELSAQQAKAREIVDALTDRSAQRVALSLTKAPSVPQPSGRATYLAQKGTLIFFASHLDLLPAGKTYELWVIPVSGKAPVPAGTFRPDEHGNANVVTAKLSGTGEAKAIGVTIEASGGSSTPTMPIIMAGS